MPPLVAPPKVTTLAGLPNAPLPGTWIWPLVTFTAPVKVLALPRTRVPEPALVSPLEPARVEMMVGHGPLMPPVLVEVIVPPAPSVRSPPLSV